MNVGDAVGAQFGAVLGPLGFAMVESDASGATFESGRTRVTGYYVPRDGELAVYVTRIGGSSKVHLLLYLRAEKTVTAERLGDAVAETEADAIGQVPLYAAGLAEAANLLSGEAEELDRASRLRWWAT